MSQRQDRSVDLPAVYSDQDQTKYWSLCISRLRSLVHNCCSTLLKWSSYVSFCLLASVVVLIIVSPPILLSVWVVFVATVNFPNMYINKASLAQFSVVPSGNGQYILNYNLTAEISLRNRQRFYTACYRSIMASAFYDSGSLGSQSIDRFCQGHKNTSTVRVEFTGNKSMELSQSGFGFLKVGSQAGSLPVDLRFETKISVKWGSSRSKWKSTNSPVYKCFLTVPIGNRTLQGGSSNPAGTKCNYHVKDPNLY